MTDAECKQHPRTNFDKWRDSLTPETYVDIQRLYVDCLDCPALGACDCKEGECRNEFLRWANAPAKEEE